MIGIKTLTENKEKEDETSHCLFTTRNSIFYLLTFKDFSHYNH